MQILLSIKPEFVSRIFAGEKRFEFRKQVPRKPFDKVFIYESAPTQNIVGWFRVGKVISGNPEYVWEACRSHAGISEPRYYCYCNGNPTVHAFEIAEFHRFAKPIDPYIKNSDFVPPQNFTYMDEYNTLTNLSEAL